MSARNKKGAATDTAVTTPNSEPRQDSPHSVDRDVGRFNGPATRCPFCGAHDPGFADSSADAQPVECASCGRSTVFGQWRDAGQLAANVLARQPLDGGAFTLTWVNGKAVVSHLEDDDASPLTIAVIWPVDNYALMSARDVPVYPGLVGLLEDLSYTVREEGGRS